jgi:hypothetical protein
MKFAHRTNNAKSTRRSGGKSCAAFTLAEVLAALLLMAIVIPVAIEAMHVATLAGTVAERKGEAARVAQRVLNENLVTTNWNQSVQSGMAMEGQTQFNWTLKNESWGQDPNQTTIQQLTVQVSFNAQNRPYSVSLSTLVNNTPPQ